jgi:hypothetical protein
MANSIRIHDYLDAKVEPRDLRNHIVIRNVKDYDGYTCCYLYHYDLEQGRFYFLYENPERKLVNVSSSKSPLAEYFWNYKAESGTRELVIFLN